MKDVQILFLYCNDTIHIIHFCTVKDEKCVFLSNFWVENFGAYSSDTIKLKKSYVINQNRILNAVGIEDKGTRRFYSVTNGIKQKFIHLHVPSLHNKCLQDKLYAGCQFWSVL